MSVSTRARSDQYHHASTIDLESVDAGPAAVTDILGPPAAVPPAQLVDQTDLQRRMNGHSRFSPQVAKDMPVESRMRPAAGSPNCAVIASALPASHTARKTLSYRPENTRDSDFDVAT